MGRPSKKAQYLAAKRELPTRAAAATKSGCALATVHKWRSEDAKFREQDDQAHEEFLTALESNLATEALVHGSPQQIWRFLTSRVGREEYRPLPKERKVELSGQVDSAVSVVHTLDYAKPGDPCWTVVAELPDSDWDIIWATLATSGEPAMRAMFRRLCDADAALIRQQAVLDGRKVPQVIQHRARPLPLAAGETDEGDGI